MALSLGPCVLAFAAAVLPSVNHQAEDASAAQPQQSALQLAAAGAGPSLARPAQSETGRVSPRQVTQHASYSTIH